MLAGLGVAAGADPDAVFVESVEDLLAEVVDDFYVRKYGDRAGGPPPFDRAAALELARAAVYDGQARLEPSAAEPGSVAATRYRFAAAVRAEVERRKRERRVFTYDDMLTRLDDALRRSPEAAARLRARYRVVLVDEFQDTDPVQWSILRRAFHGHTTLVLIGDPKQAIYAFRGADVVTLPGGHAHGRRTTPRSPPTTAATRRCSPALEHGVRRGRARRRADRRAPGGRPRGPVGGWRRAVRRAGARAGRVPRRPAHPAAARRAARRSRARRWSSPIWRRTWRACSPAAATVDGAADAAGRRRRAGAHQRPGGHGAGTRSPAVGVPAVVTGTASVFGTPRRGRLAHAAGGPRAAPAGPAPRRRAHLLPRPHRRGAVRACGGCAARRAGRHRAGAGPRCCTSGGWRRCWRRSPPTPACPRACSPAPTASGGSRICGTSRRRCTPSPSTRTSGPARSWSGCAGASPRPGSTSGSSAAGGWSPTPPPCRSSPIHRSKGLEFPVVYVPFGWDRNVRDPDVPLLHVGTDAGARRRRGERRGLPRALRGAPGRGGGRGPPAVLRGAHPGEVPGRAVVGAVHHHRRVAGAPAAHRATRAGHGARRSATACRPTTAAWAALRGLASSVLAVERVGRPPPGAVHAARGADRRAHGGHVHPLARPALAAHVLLGAHRGRGPRRRGHERARGPWRGRRTLAR